MMQSLLKREKGKRERGMHARKRKKMSNHVSGSKISKCNIMCSNHYVKAIFFFLSPLASTQEISVSNSFKTLVPVSKLYENLLKKTKPQCYVSTNI